MSCTTMLVGKAASYDGSTITARDEDCGSDANDPKRLVVVHPDEQPRHYKSVNSHCEVELPDNPMRYTAAPEANLKDGIWAASGINEANVGMDGTETIDNNERVLGADPMVELVPAKGEPGEEGHAPEVPGGLGEEDFVTLVLPYIRSAREGVRRLGELLERYGTYECNGIAFSDVDEVWWMETIGGHHWIARRVPDDCYVTMPNQLGIDSFDLADAEGAQLEHMASADLREFIAKNHLDLQFREPDDPGDVINPRIVFGTASDSDHVYNTPRAWYMQRFLNPHSNTWDGPDADYRPEDDDIPWCRVPERKITIEDVKHALSLHFQGTPYDPYGKAGDASQRGRYRCIGLNRNSQLSVQQIRPYMPESCRAIHWQAMGSTIYNALVPIYANVDDIPAYLRDTTTRVTSENHYWHIRIIAALADAHFASCQQHVERYQLAVGSKAHAHVIATDAKAADLSYADAAPVLGEANEAMVAFLKDETDKLLDRVLKQVTVAMRSAFSREDA